MTRNEAGATNRPYLAAIVAGVVGGLLGALTATLTLGNEPQAPVGERLDALDRHLQELTAAVRDRPVATPDPPQRFDATAEPRAPIELLQPGPSADLQALVARTDALLGRLETAAASGQRPLTVPDPAVTADARRALLEPPKKKYEDDDLPPDLYFMNYQQVLDRYGLPQRMHGGQGDTTIWDYYDPDDHDRRRSLIFADGLLADWARL